MSMDLNFPDISMAFSPCVQLRVYGTAEYSDTAISGLSDMSCDIRGAIIDPITIKKIPGGVVKSLRCS
jgi:hypothetical protein